MVSAAGTSALAGINKTAGRYGDRAYALYCAMDARLNRLRFHCDLLGNGDCADRDVAKLSM